MLVSIGARTRGRTCESADHGQIYCASHTSAMCSRQSQAESQKMSPGLSQPVAVHGAARGWRTLAPTLFGCRLSHSRCRQWWLNSGSPLPFRQRLPARVSDPHARNHDRSPWRPLTWGQFLRPPGALEVPNRPNEKDGTHCVDREKADKPDVQLVR